MAPQFTETLSMSNRYQNGLRIPFTAEELQERLRRRELERSQEALHLARAEGAGNEARYKLFLERDIDERDIQRFTRLVDRAIVQGQRECLVLKFPTIWTTDRGRSINCGEDHWPDTLTGFAARVHNYYLEALQPAGFRIRAQIISWPDGLPGDAGVFIGW